MIENQYKIFSSNHFIINFSYFIVKIRVWFYIKSKLNSVTFIQSSSIVMYDEVALYKNSYCSDFITINFLSFLRLRTVWNTFNVWGCLWISFISCTKEMKTPVRLTPSLQWTTVRLWCINFSEWMMSKIIKQFLGISKSGHERLWNIVTICSLLFLKSEKKVEQEFNTQWGWII